MRTEEGDGDDREQHRSWESWKREKVPGTTPDCCYHRTTTGPYHMVISSCS